MTPLFRKLNLGAQTTVHVLGAPASFEPELAALEDVKIERTISGSASFALAFVVTQAERDATCAQLLGACGDHGDAIVWIAYPKGMSKRYRCEFNRDSGWSVLGAAGFEPVRQVAIDADWSALRFRRTEHIPTLRRDPARTISRAGNAKAKAAK
jgi:hypothetical protein